jgi:8-oxo-dGTP diphosphatase
MNDKPTKGANAFIHVAAAALVDQEGRVLLARRHDDSHQGGLWEFPGGKLEPGETVEQGLRRELHEELGIEIAASRPLIRIRHDYPDRSVLLDVHRVAEWRGEPHGREGQPLAWVASDALDDYPMPAADVPIVTALQLPSSYLITPPRIGDPDRFIDSLENALAQGLELLQLRLFDLDDAALRQIGGRVCERCHARGARVLLNGSVEQAEAIGCDGLHLSSTALYRHRQRPLGRGRLLAASCHSADDLLQAARLGADFALLSPVLPTRSHPDADPLGWAHFADLATHATLPVYALGGMQPALLQTAWEHGAQGIAGIRGLWPEGDA